MERLASEIGRALRRARQARGLTLHGVAEASDGRFKATSVAGYERGERNISVERFCALCLFYEVDPGEVLAEVIQAIERRTEPVIDLTVLEALGPEQSALVASFVQQIQSLRKDQSQETIVLRSGDLAVLATAAGRDPEELLQLLRAARRGTTGPEGSGADQTPRR